MNEFLDIKLQVAESSDILSDISEIIIQSKQRAYKAIDLALLQRNYLIGKRINDEELKETRKDNYGLEIISKLAKELTAKFGSGFSKRNLYHFYNFYKTYGDILQTASAQSLLSWSHYLCLMSVSDLKAREWYEKEASSLAWSVRTLQRNIDSQYYYRMLSSQVKDPVIHEMEKITIDYQLDRLEHVKNPIILEFLGLSQSERFLESDLESAIITNLQKMLIELGKGYAFVGRQYHIHTGSSDYYVDLVFYNYILRCFVLVDLNVGRITHQDVGQMDMYVRMFDDFIKGENDNPTLGIVLCSETNEDIARYSVLKGNEQLFATKYKLFLPSEEELKVEIEHQKTLFMLSKINHGRK